VENIFKFVKIFRTDAIGRFYIAVLSVIIFKLTISVELPDMILPPKENKITKAIEIIVRAALLFLKSTLKTCSLQLITFCATSAGQSVDQLGRLYFLVQHITN